MKLLVIDNSEYVEFARTLGRSGLFESVGYFAPWQQDMPFAQEYMIGSGFEEIKRETELFACLDEYDAYAFPALYHCDLQRWLRHRGASVWGSGDSEMLERDRIRLLETMRQLGMDIPSSKVVTLEELRKGIKVGDVAKISTFRGDIETFTHKGDYAWYFELGKKWGPLRESLPIVWQKPLPKGAEPGFDLLIVRGKPVLPFSVGYEVKDHGYIEKNYTSLDEMPRPLYPIYEGVMEMIDAEYSNFLSTEVLSGVLLDITTRIPQPPGDLKLHIWPYLSTVVFNHLADGPVADSEPRAKWGAQLLALNNNPQQYVRWGKESDFDNEHIKFCRAFTVNGEIWSAPALDRSQVESALVGSVVASGASPQKAVAALKEIAEEIECPKNVAIETGTLEALMEAMEKGEKEGIVL